MIASTSHDMRTPLNTIINMLTMIQEKISDPFIIRWIRIALNSSNLLMFLVNDTLDYFQIKSGKFTLKNEKISIRELINNCFDLVQIQIE